MISQQLVRTKCAETTSSLTGTKTRQGACRLRRPSRREAVCFGSAAPVLLEVFVAAERAAAVLADEWPLACMHAHVVVQVGLVVGGVGAVGALEAVRGWLLLAGSCRQALVRKCHTRNQRHVTHGPCKQGATCNDKGKERRGRFDGETRGR